jgi:hypothetical protein
MTFELSVTDPHARDLFERIEKSLQRFGATKLIHKRSDRQLARAGTYEVDGALRITASKHWKAYYLCEAKRKLDANALAPITGRLREAAAAAHAKPLVIATYVNDLVGEKLRENKIDYIDTAGNVHLASPPLYVWMRGFKPTEKPERFTRAFQSTGLQLIALLLSQPRATNWPYRKMAETAGLSLGSTSRILSDLRSLGFIKLKAEEQDGLVNRRNLLEHWEFGYSTRLRPHLKPQAFRQADTVPMEELPERIPAEMSEDVLVGGELAAAIATRHLRPQSVTFHLRPHRPLLPIIKALKLVPDRRGNVVVVEQFGQMDVWRWDEYQAHRLVRPLLVHAEMLCGTPDDRLSEAATFLFEKHIAPMLSDE